MKNIVKMMAAILLVATCLSVKAQDKKAAKLAEVKQKVETQNYNILAQFMIPQGGSNKVLTTDEYDFRVKKDSVISYLPYYGQAYFDVPYNPTDGGIKFTSTKFDYTVKKKKKGWDIAIFPHDVRNVKQVFITISETGYASMSFNFDNRSTISFNGELRQ